MLSRSERKRIRALGNRKDREEQGLFLAEGVRLVEEVLDAGLEFQLAAISPALRETPRGAELADRLHGAGPVREVGVGELNELADTETNQGVLLVVETPSSNLDVIPSEGPSAVLLMDGVQDPGNLGTSVRSAAAFGCHAAVCLPGTVDPWNAKAVRASAGALFRIPIIAAEAHAAMDVLAGAGFMTLGAAMEGRPVDRLALSERTVLAVGNEGSGLSGFMRSRVDSLVAVPMVEEIESLNVAVATGILLYVLTRNAA